MIITYVCLGSWCALSCALQWVKPMHGWSHSQNSSLSLATTFSHAPYLGMPPPYGFSLHIKISFIFKGD